MANARRQVVVVANEMHVHVLGKKNPEAKVHAFDDLGYTGP
jgi:hypothetical protein